MRKILLGSTAIALTFTAVPAFAQEKAPADAGADSGIAEIIVTAQRREENIQKAAVPVDVISGGDLVKTGLTSVNQLQQISPALNVSAAGGSNSTLFVRGVGNFSSNSYSDPATAFNYDGVYVGRTAGTAGLFYDLQRIEVLKGPQGTLYGRNATAGAINVIPVKPKLGSLSGEANISYGNYNALNVEGAINVPIGSNSAARLSGVHSRRDGFLTDGTSDENVTGLRGQFLTEFSPDLSVRLSLDAEKVRGKGGGATYDALATAPALNSISTAATGLADNVGLLDPAAQAFRRAQFNGQVGTNLPALPTNVYERDNFIAVLADIEYKTPIGTISIIPAYRHSKIDDIHVSPGFPIWNRETYKQTSVEARIGGARGNFDYVVGGYYFNEDINANDTINQQTLTSYQDFITNTKSVAVFGRLTFHITDTFRITGGYRFTNDKKRINATVDTLLRVCGPFGPDCVGSPFLSTTDTPEQQPFAVPARTATGPTLVFASSGAPAGLTIRFPADVVTSQSAKKSTFRAAAEFDIAPKSLLYASVETGFHAGGFSLAPGYETFKPETITAYTLGLKSRLMDNHLQVNLEAFDWEYKNQQVAHFGINGAPGGGFPDFFTENVGRSRIRGVEADSQLLPWTNTLLHASVQYLDAKYLDFKYTLPLLGGTPVTGCPVTAGTSYTVDCSHHQSFNSPKWTITLGAAQTIPLQDDFAIELAVDTQYRSSRFVGFEYLASERAAADWRSNASVTLSKGDFSLTGFIRNIEGDRTISSSTYYGSGSVVVNRHESPRTFGVRVGAKF